MFKLKIISYAILFTCLFTVSSGCSGGGGENKKDSGEINSSDPVVEDPIIAPNIECPAGYIAVPSNSDVGVDNDFCVMKYEAKNDGSGNPISQAEKTPWVLINQADAKAACRSLNTESNDSDIDGDTGDDGTFALISNPEWMTIARNIENVDSNWTGGTRGTGCLFRGNVGAKLPCEGGDSGYNGPDPHFGLERSETAKLTLDNGEEVWDFSGNVWDIIDWNIAQGDKAYILADGKSSVMIEFTDLDTNIGKDNVMSPDTWQPTDPNLDSTNGIGKYHLFTREIDTVVFRGGDWGSVGAGAFALLIFEDSSSFLNASFRCVYRP